MVPTSFPPGNLSLPLALFDLTQLDLTDRDAPVDVRDRRLAAAQENRIIGERRRAQERLQS